jgi:hypothetical protein
MAPTNANQRKPIVTLHDAATICPLAPSDQAERQSGGVHARPQRAFWLNAMTGDPGVPEGCRVLAQYLFRHVNRDGTWWRHRKALAEEMGVSGATLARRIRGLRDRGYIDVQAYFQPSQRGRQTPSAFGIRLPNGLRHPVPEGPSGCVAGDRGEAGEAPPVVTADTPPRVTADTPTRVTGDTPQKKQGFQEAGVPKKEHPLPPTPSPQAGRGSGGGGQADEVTFVLPSGREVRWPRDLLEDITERDEARWERQAREWTDPRREAWLDEHYEPLCAANPGLTWSERSLLLEKLPGPDWDAELDAAILAMRRGWLAARVANRCRARPIRPTRATERVIGWLFLQAPDRQGSLLETLIEAERWTWPTLTRMVAR